VDHAADILLSAEIQSLPANPYSPFPAQDQVKTPLSLAAMLLPGRIQPVSGD
jgi:hypothetical protein